jgi:endonuclease YncB( thermonuclease family)/methylphosphotriester-DNA--protein-cysteine methyltransferase
MKASRLSLGIRHYLECYAPFTEENHSCGEENSVKSQGKTALLLVFMLVCVGAGSARQAAASSTGQSRASKAQPVIEGKVVKVSDGDTITVLDKENREHKIRFQGIDAPESKQAFGQVSKDNLARMIMGKEVKVVWSKRDKYGRTVGKVLLDGQDVNIEQVKAGLAWHYKKYSDEQPPEDRVTYAAAETEARAARRGLWQDPDPTPPGDWRVEAKTDRWGPAPPEGTIVGNKTNKKYHRPDCPGYRDMAERNRVFFKTVSEAEAAGFQRAGNCPAQAVAQSTTAKPAYSSSTTTSAASTAPKTAVAAPAAASTSAQTAQAPTPPAATDSGAVIGNKNSKIYHRPDCPGYKGVSEKNQVKFNTVEEAEAAGYRVAKNCPAPK